MHNLTIPPTNPRTSDDPTDALRRRRAFTLFAVVVAVVLLLGGCWVNQNAISIADKVDPGSKATPRAIAGGVAYGPHPEQLLDVHLPRGPAQGTIVYVHSGGWTGGTRTEIPALILQNVDRGWAVVSIDHRLADGDAARAPEVLADVDRAIRFVRANGPALGVDTSTLVVSGWSAGAHLALMAAVAPGFQVAPDLPPELAATPPAVDAVISLAATSDLATWGQANPIGQSSVHAFLGCTPRPAPTLTQKPCEPLSADLYSPSYRAALAVWFGQRLPPAYIANANDDPLVPVHSQGTVLHDRWAAAAGDLATYYDVPPAGGHDVSLQVNKTVFEWWLGKVKARSF